MTVSEQQMKERRELKSALFARQKPGTAAQKSAAESRAAAVITRGLPAAARNVANKTLADLATGLRLAADAGKYDGGCYGDDYQAAVAKVGARFGIDVTKIPPEVHDRLKRLA